MLGFNSSMVRLGENKAQIKEATLVSFQFQYGSIGSQYDRIRFTNIASFNSSMVRLGAYKNQTELAGILLFQFQYGSIGRIIPMLTTIFRMLFQFQYGSIGRPTR